MLKDFSKLYSHLNYTFINQSLLIQALTHRSFSLNHNERFEFLGDSILNCIIANKLFHLLPNYNEGQLSRLRAHLVREDSLAKIASSINLGEFIYFGIGELKTGGNKRVSILANTLEAIIAAVFLDTNFDTVSELIDKLFAHLLKNDVLNENVKDAKSMLQEYLQSKKLSLPNYELYKTSGAEHEQIFYVSCKINEYETTGSGATRRIAEQYAAQKLLNILNNDN